MDTYVTERVALNIEKSSLPRLVLGDIREEQYVRANTLRASSWRHGSAILSQRSSSPVMLAAGMIVAINIENLFLPLYLLPQAGGRPFQEDFTEESLLSYVRRKTSPVT